MKLADQNLKELVEWIITGGEEKRLASIYLAMVKYEREPTLCPISHEQIDCHSRGTYVITDAIGKLIFEDAFADANCARIAHDWLKYLLVSYRRFVVEINCSVELTDEQYTDFSKAIKKLDEFEPWPMLKKK